MVTCLRYESSAQRARQPQRAPEAKCNRTDGRVVLFDEVVLNQLDGERRLANTTSADNNLRTLSGVRSPYSRMAERAATYQFELGHFF
jgi:hypothetical protein